MRWREGLAVVFLMLGLGAWSPVTAWASTDAREVDYHDLDDSDAEIFMQVQAARQDIAAVRDELQRLRTVEEFAYLDHHDALAEARRIFKGDKALVKNLTAAMLPPSFRVHFASHVGHDEFEKRFVQRRGVDEVKFTPTKAELRAARKVAARDRACRGDVDVEVFMTVQATTEQEDAVATALSTTPGIESVERVSHDQAVSTFGCLFPDEPVPPAATLPASFRLRVGTMSVVILLAQTVENMPGVDDVEY